MKQVRLFARVAAVAVLLHGCASTTPVGEEAEVLAALTAFVRAFENGDLEAMEAAFSEESTSFPRTAMSSEITDPIEIADYRRVGGMPPGMRALVARFQASPNAPPYMTLDPKDLEIRVFTDAAIATFHLENERSLSRRTFVLAKEEGSWKIVHLHPSNVVGSE